MLELTLLIFSLIWKEADNHRTCLFWGYKSVVLKYVFLFYNTHSTSRRRRLSSHGLPSHFKRGKAQWGNIRRDTGRRNRDTTPGEKQVRAAVRRGRARKNNRVASNAHRHGFWEWVWARAKTLLLNASVELRRQPKSSLCRQAGKTRSPNCRAWWFGYVGVSLSQCRGSQAHTNTLRVSMSQHIDLQAHKKTEIQYIN